MRTGSKGNEPNWKVIAIAGIAIAAIVGFIVAPMEAYAFIAGSAIIGAMAIDEA